MNDRQHKWDLRYLDTAKHISAYSKDPSTKVGAVIVGTDNYIVAQGYNGFARGVIDSEERLSNRDLKYRLVIHGEMNAVISARRDLRGCTLYTYPFMPCSQCASMVIQAGIKRVVSYVNDNPRWVESFALSSQLFKEAGVELVLYAEIKTRSPEIEVAIKHLREKCSGTWSVEDIARELEAAFLDGEENK